ncbi:MAG: hypothetical protein A2269_03635 [Lentisphaerae bacterium RIFOXYA12_FULL_60_10]|nr:MAG: hypothetical protein A2269_03635 [Lentisphaerae bacterium RIFOXYA12_FULL_60_10]
MEGWAGLYPLILNVHNLVVRHQNTPVLEGISFTVAAGDYLGIVGPNGSGKTTLVRALLGLVETDAGTIELFGQPQPEFRQWNRIGYLPQFSRIPTHRFPAKVHEIVAMGLRAGKPFPHWPSHNDDQAVDLTLDLLGIADLRDRLIGRLSGGQRQRVFLARALVAQPELLILDEPVVALDPQSRERFYETIAQLNRDRQVTILMVSHDMATMHDYARTLLYLDRRVVFVGALASFCKSEAMQTYFGGALQHMICGQHHGHEPLNPPA